MRFDTSRAAQLIRSARADAGLTQEELACRAGIQQASLAQMETGSRGVSGDMLERVLQAADYRPAVPLSEQASSIRDVASRLGFSRLRVFGSAARGEDWSARRFVDSGEKPEFIRTCEVKSVLCRLRNLVKSLKNKSSRRFLRGLGR